MNDNVCLQFALKELEEANEDYKNEKVDIYLACYRSTTLIFWLGAFLNKKYDYIQVEDEPMSRAIRFACNVLKHDKQIFEIGQGAVVISGIGGRMRCGESLNFSNSINAPTIIWKDLTENGIDNQEGLEEYNKCFKNKQLSETFNLIKNLVVKYDKNN